MTKKQKRKLVNRILTIATILLAAALIVVCVFVIKDKKKVRTAEVDLTDRVTAQALVWLSEIQDMPLSYDEVKACMGSVVLRCEDTPTGEKGVYTRKAVPESYGGCYENAYAGLENAYVKVFNDRIEKKGQEGKYTKEDVDKTVQKAYGISLREYLVSKILLLPSEEELLAEIEGEVRYE